ncbi:transcriptional regulator with XRE-family HTH domain [Acetoanaerobium pronyense]|uniref:Transcriptional regulator with XRE-family HTH domain n=1 Tax=Acetoanaerobium pronyense TaxID=1482736 RepID=A0ABS4KK19_9FIRM|nr:helix-turn-helix transcriptional regulator [Acetoanaerobium pronyense]MBP2028124.1 transcriptional regulator with XRE-family HTH domain [Acetoanaerobium pronyense]
MNFGEKIKELRKKRGFSQSELAEKIGVTQKTICNYENGTRFPKGQKIINGFADIFDVSIDYLLDDTEIDSNKQNIKIEYKDEFISTAKENFGYKGKKEAENLLEKTAAIFSGGSLSDEDKDAFFQSITELYFDAKSKSRKKYGKKGIGEPKK